MKIEGFDEFIPTPVPEEQQDIENKKEIAQMYGLTLSEYLLYRICKNMEQQEDD